MNRQQLWMKKLDLLFPKIEHITNTNVDRPWFSRQNNPTVRCIFRQHNFFAFFDLFTNRNIRNIFNIIRSMEMRVVENIFTARLVSHAFNCTIWHCLSKDFVFFFYLYKVAEKKENIELDQRVRMRKRGRKKALFHPRRSAAITFLFQK